MQGCFCNRIGTQPFPKRGSRRFNPQLNQLIGQFIHDGGSQLIEINKALVKLALVKPRFAAQLVDRQAFQTDSGHERKPCVQERSTPYLIALFSGYPLVLAC